jgi:two-component system chemotaxis response regulator CheY
VSEIVLGELAGLVIDDDPASRELMAEMLNYIGVGEVRGAADGPRAIQMMRNYNPDFVVCDIQMQPMDGITFTKEVRTGDLSPNPFVTILLLTGDPRVEVVRQARDAGAHGFLAKPLSMDTLRRRLEQALSEDRDFIKSRNYTGPDRRRRQVPLAGKPDRRKDR